MILSLPPFFQHFPNTPNHPKTPRHHFKPNATSSTLRPNLSNKFLRHVTHSEEEEGEEGEESLVCSGAAIAAAIRKVSTSPVEFVQTVQKYDNGEKRRKSGLVLPSLDFQRLCEQQLELFRRIVGQDADLSVYVRPAGSYVMDRLELRRVIFFQGENVKERADIVILIASFGVPTGLRVAESALSNQQVDIISECRAVVFPMIKHPFIVGFLVAELPSVGVESGRNGTENAEGVSSCKLQEDTFALRPSLDRKNWEIQVVKDDQFKTYDPFTAEQRSSVINISRSLAMAYVMDQKAMLLQQSSWQNNIRMSDLVEQIRGPLSSIRTLSKMLSINLKRSEISYDIVEDILVQGNHMRDTLEQLQDAVYLTKANIVHYNEETLKKINNSMNDYTDWEDSQLPSNFTREHYSDKTHKLGKSLPSSSANDLEMPMPPLALIALRQHDIRPCNMSDILADLVMAARPLARSQQREVELNELSPNLQVAVEESALRQALSNLIEGAMLRTHAGGKVEIISADAPAGGALVVVDDDGLDMHYMTQMHSLTPFGTDLFSEGTIEDNMTWNFVAGLTIAREILESYGCVVRVISPRTQDASLGAGGTRIELWLPSLPSTSEASSPTQEV